MAPIRDPIKASGERLRVLREAYGVSAKELGERVNRSESAVRNQENGTNGIPATLAEKYARILGTSAAFILYGDPAAAGADAPESEHLLIRRRAQAGAWLSIDDFDQREPRRYPATRDPAFPRADQWLVEVVGDSVNQLGINDGDYCHCVDIEQARYQVNTGDIVEVHRSRHQGADLECSIKQVEVTKSGILLWPRSNNPRWIEPLKILEGMEGEDMQVMIQGLVISSIRRFRPTGG